MAAEGVDVSLREVVDALVPRAVARWGGAGAERQDVAWRVRPDDLAPFSRGGGARGAGRRAGRPCPAAGPGWPRPASPRACRSRTASPTGRGPGSASATTTSASRRRCATSSLVTVCEEAGCPNIFECWADGTATFMINGERCTRACGFCLVDTRHPGPLDAGEPERVAEAVEQMGLAYAVVTAVARDDLADGGASRLRGDDRSHPRGARPATQIEVLIPDCKGDPDALADDLRRPARRAQPQRRDRAAPPAGGAAVGRLRPEPGRARPGQGGRPHDQVGAHRRAGRDGSTRWRRSSPTSRAVGVDIVTVGQYLRPDRAAPAGRPLVDARGLRPREGGRASASASRHVEATPLTRSSYHARQAAEAAVGAATMA